MMTDFAFSERYRAYGFTGQEHCSGDKFERDYERTRC